MPRALAAWQHRFDVDSNFLSYPGRLSLVQFRPKFNKFTCEWYWLPPENFIEFHSVFARREAIILMLARNIAGTDNGTTGHSENIIVSVAEEA